jgi:hypothetical protein
MKNILIALLFSITLNSILVAEEAKKLEEIKNKDAVEIYEKYALKPFTDFWTGYGYTRNFDGKKFKVSGFGMDEDLMKMLMESPSAKSLMTKYKEENIIGNILYWSGLGAMIAGIVYANVLPRQSVTTTDQAVYWSLFGGGFVTSMVGVAFIVSAYQKAQEAVWQYNKDLISGATKVTQLSEPHFNLAFNIKF